MSTATPRPWLTLLLLAFTALLWSLPSFAAVPPKCTINGATGSTAYTDCILPPLVAWDAPSGSGAPGNSRFATPGDAGLVYFQYRMDHDTMPNTCQYGCTLDIQDGPDPYKYTMKNVIRRVYLADGTYAQQISHTDRISTCPVGYFLFGDRDADGIQIVEVCRPNNPGSLLRARSNDLVNAQGCVKGCNPVDLGDLRKTDWVVDYQNHSPYPIVWGRTYNGLLRSWIFNYDRKLSIGYTPTLPNQAFVALTRQDGSQVGFAGVLSGGVWTWVPQLDTPAKTALIQAALTSNAALTSFVLHTRTNEMETYDGAGRLVSLSDERNLPLTFAYDTQGRLSLITDASARTLTITYPADNAAHPVPITDHAGTTTTSSYTDPDLGLVSQQIRFAPEIVTDGTRSVGYVFAVNPLDTSSDPGAVLSQVIQPDSSVLTYNYNRTGQYLGLTDENGDRYSTYTYVGDNTDKVKQTQHGVGQETILYSNTKVTFPNSASMTFANDATTLYPKTQNNKCSWCTGDQSKTTTFDANGNPASSTDFNGNVTTKVFDPNWGVPTSITEAAGTSQARTTTITWDSRFRKPTGITYPVETPNGVGSSTTTNTYDSQGNRTAWSTTVTGPSGYTRTRSGSATFNSFSEPLTITDARGKTTTFTYDAIGNLATLQDALGHTTTYSSYDTAGNVGEITDPNGLHTVFTYDARQRVAQIQRGCAPGSAADCHWETTTITYNPMGAIAQVVGPNGRGIAYHYDTAHRRTSEDVLDTSGAVMGTITYVLNVSSEITSTTYKDATGVVVQTQGLGYDTLSRLTAVIDSHNKTFGQTWDAQGNKTNTTDPLSHNQTIAYDPLNRPTQVTLPDLLTEQVGYGVDDTAINQTDAKGLVTATAFNGFQEAVGRSSPDSGSTGFTRDANGNTLTQTDARGITLTTTFDDLNRPHTQTGSTGGSAEQITWDYDSCTNGLGRLCSVTDRTGSIAFTYDRWGRRTSQVQITHAHTFTTVWAYDTAGQLASITYPSGQVLTQTWVNGEVTGQTWGLAPGTGATIFGGVQTDPWGRLLSGAWASGRTFGFGYDLDGRISSQASANAGTLTTGQTYAFDDAWRLTGITQQPAATATTFGYDNRDRLTSGTTWGSYTYDGNTNRLSWLGPLGPQSYSMVVSSNRLGSINASAVTSDAAGNLTSKPGLSLTFDDWSRLRTATAGGITTTYQVNGLHERVGKTAGTTARVYVYSRPGHLLGVYDGGTGATLEELAYRGDRPMATMRSGLIYPIETDHLNTPLRVLDAANTVVWSWEDREPFGGSAPTEGLVGGVPFVFNLRFPGQWFDGESGLISNGYRDYDPMLGRYVEMDPIGLAAGMNGYAYVGGNPVGYFDQDGLRKVNVYIWYAKIGSFSAGHVMVTEDKSHQVILSQFPDKKWIVGKNITKSFDETLSAEGRKADAVWEINVLNDAAFDRSSAHERSLENWTAAPTEASTQCSIAASRALQDGGVSLTSIKEGTLMPGFFDNNIKKNKDISGNEFRRLYP